MNSDTHADVESPQFDTNVVSKRLDLNDFGFDISDGASIVGVMLQIERFTDPGSARDQVVRLMIGGSPGTTVSKVAPAGRSKARFLRALRQE